MPDYSLTKRTVPLPPQTQPDTPTPLSLLSSASQQSKEETGNALLREALAKSAQNYEASITQLAESQELFQRQVMERITLWQQNLTDMDTSTKRRLDAMAALIEQYGKTSRQQISQYSQSHQSQLTKLENMNEAFSKNLNGVLNLMTDKIISHVEADTKTALNETSNAMNSIVESMKTASKGLTGGVDSFTKKINNEFKASKAKLDIRVKNYNTSMEKLFEVDTKHKRFFYTGIIGGIATPLALLAILLFHILN